MPTRDRGAATGRRLLVSVGSFLLFVALVPHSALCAVVEQHMEIKDRSGKRSPIQISGHMTIAYDSANRFPFSYQKSISIKNISAKSILLMVVHFGATSGPLRDERFSQEYFFGESLAAGDAEAHDFPEQRFGATIVNGQSVPYKKDPHPAAQARAEFVQFTDGTTWGNPESAEDVLSLRQKTLAELDLLQHLYEQKGESAFLDELSQADDFSNVFGQLKGMCNDKSAKANCLYSAVLRTLTATRTHEATINSEGHRGTQPAENVP